MIIEKPKDKQCAFNDLKRTRYFHGMLMSERDFEDEQKYHVGKRKLLNKMLHGWGVVCGLGLGIADCKPSTVIIGKGMALDCNGNEIDVDTPYELDVEKAIESYKTHETQLTDKEMCEEMDRLQTGPYIWYVVIKYREGPIAPVPVYAPGGGCEEKVCEHSRIREGFCIELHKEKPYQPRQKIDSLAEKIYDNCRKEETERGREGKADYNEKCMKEKLGEFMQEFCDSTPDCPGCCPCEHYVILGTVVVKTENNKKTYSVDSNEGRQYVFTPHLFKYLFRILFEGTEKILKDQWPELCIQDMPDVNLLHENPIAALCWLGKRLSELIKEKEEKKEPNPDTNLDEITITEAKEIIKNKGYKYGNEILLTEENRSKLIELSNRPLPAKDAQVDVVINEKKQALFFIPANVYTAEVSFKEELDRSKREIEKQLKTVDEKYKKVIEELKTEIKNLKETKKKTT